MKEISRKLFVTLNQERHMFYILNDQNFICKFYADTTEIAKAVFEAYLKGDYRERYAIENHEWIKAINGCLIFEYGTDDTYQDANGATYHIGRKEWIN